LQTRPLEQVRFLERKAEIRMQTIVFFQPVIVRGLADIILFAPGLYWHGTRLAFVDSFHPLFHTELSFDLCNFIHMFIPPLSILSLLEKLEKL
jgi:hypothetical protein